MDEKTPKLSPLSRTPRPISRPLPLTENPLLSPSQAAKQGLEDARKAIRLRTSWPRMQRLCVPRSGRFWVLGGLPGNFKTQLMWNLALDMADHNQRVLFVSLEEDAGSMSLMAMSRYSQIPRDRITVAQLAGDLDVLSTQEQEALALADDRLRRLELRMRLHASDANGRSTKHVIRSACRSRFDAVFIDHLGMMAREGENEFREVARAVDEFRGLTRGEVVDGYRPFVCLSSPLNRDSQRDDTKDRIPRMSDLRGSQRIESDADLVMIVQKRPRDPGDEEGASPDLVDGFVLKNRQGRCPVVLLFEANGATATVTERTPPQQPPPRHFSETERDE